MFIDKEFDKLVGTMNDAPYIPRYITCDEFRPVQASDVAFMPESIANVPFMACYRAHNMACGNYPDCKGG